MLGTSLLSTKVSFNSSSSLSSLSLSSSSSYLSLDVSFTLTEITSLAISTSGSLVSSNALLDIFDDSKLLLSSIFDSVFVLAFSINDCTFYHFCL